MIAEFLIFAIVGIITGTMAGLFGVGGGLIIVPVMHFILTSNGLEESLAIPLSIGTALACIIFTSSSAAYSHYQKGSLSLKRFSQLTVGILVGAGFGSSFVINVDSEILKTMLAVFVSVMALRLFININMPKAKKEPNFLFFNLLYLVFIGKSLKLMARAEKIVMPISKFQIVNDLSLMN